MANAADWAVASWHDATPPQKAAAAAAVAATAVLGASPKLRRSLNCWRLPLLLLSVVGALLARVEVPGAGLEDSLFGLACSVLPGWLGLAVGDVLAVLVVYWLLTNLGHAQHMLTSRALHAALAWAKDCAFALASLLPPVSRKVSAELTKLEGDLEKSVKGEGWRERPRLVTLPKQGRGAEDILRDMAAAAKVEDSKWEEGRVSGAVYHGGRQHMELLDKAYSLFSLANPLHTDIWPSVCKYEAEVIAMTARMVDGGDEGVCGSLTSGGTESIMLAAKAHWHYYRARGITSPEIVACVSAHAAIEKGCSLMGIRLIKVPMDPHTYKVSVSAVRRSLTANTIMIYASAPSFPQGIIDPITELSASLPQFDFSVPGVTSMSCDTHKYGYAAKGTSVVLYRNKELRAHQYFCFPDWTGGLYVTPTLAGSRPGGLVAACWASMVSLGEEGYVAAASSIIQSRHKVLAGMANMSDLHVLGDPQAMIVCFGSRTLNIYRVGDAMTHKGWSLNALQHPPCLHLCITLRTVGREDLFVEDLRASVAEAKGKAASGAKDEGTAAMYGTAGSLPSGPLRAIMTTYADVVYKA